MFIGSLKICGNNTLLGLLNSSIARLGILVPIGVDLIWSKYS